MKIVHDAGHGYDTAGKRVPGDLMREWSFNSAVATLVMNELEKYKNVTQIRVDDPTGSVDVSLKARTDRANAFGADVFISYHANAFGVNGFNSAQGVETFVHTSKPKEAVALATKLQSALIKETGRMNRGVKYQNFHVLRETKMTSVLLEMGFMTNREEASLLQSTSYRKKCAKAIIDVLVAHYKLTLKPVPKTAPKAQVMHRVVTGSFADRANAEIRIAELKRAGFDSFIEIKK